MSMTHTKTNTKTNTQTKTNTKCFKNPMYVIFLKSTGFKDFKYDMDMDMKNMVVMDMDVLDTKTNTNTNTKTKRKQRLQRLGTLSQHLPFFNVYKWQFTDLLALSS